MGPTVGEFHYRLRAPVSGYRPGSHPGTALGSGHEFAAHVRLLDNPDPRRIDIRASLRNVRREWLTQVYRQRAALAVYAVVDVSGVDAVRGATSQARGCHRFRRVAGPERLPGRRPGGSAGI